MKLKKGDNIIVLTGKDKGKKAKILRVVSATNRVIVEGVNEVKRRRKPRKGGEKGQIVNMPMPIDASNVALFCGTCGKARRAGMSTEGSKKVRICVNCKSSI